MAVKLRLRRMGKKKQPIYKVVAADARSPRDGKYIESVGLYNPLKDPHIVELREDRVNYWLDNGAQPTDTVKSLFKQKGIILKRELKSKGLTEDKIQEELENWAKLREAKKSTAKRKSKSKPEAASEVKEEPGVKPDTEIKEEPKAKSDTEIKKEPQEKLEAKSKSEENKAENSEEKNENSEKSTAEVKGAASDESSTKSE